MPLMLCYIYRWNFTLVKFNSAKSINNKNDISKVTYLQSHWNIISVSLWNQVPAIGQRPLLSAPNHSGRRVTFSLAVELSRLAQPDRHILWLQHQHGFGCRGREQQLASNVWHLSVALIGALVRVFQRVGSVSSSHRAQTGERLCSLSLPLCCWPRKHKRQSGSSLQEQWWAFRSAPMDSKEIRQMGHLIHKGVDYGYECSMLYIKIRTTTRYFSRW